MTPEQLAVQMQGRVSIPYEDALNPGRPLVLECFRAADHTPDKPVVLVLHGMGRNGDEYCDAWVPAAEKHGLLIVAITFPTEAWPGSAPYNDGLVWDEDGALRPQEAWSNAIPARVFQHLREAGITRREKAYLWGHSAGGQFVHRLMGLQPLDSFEAASPANAGWYTLPTMDVAYPQGLSGIGLDDAALERLLAYPMVIFAGDKDIETGAANLPRHTAALAQGPHRFARAHFYLEAGRAEAARRGVPFGWTLVIVPGVGHEGMVMSGVAAAYWFEGKMPSVALGRLVGVEL